MRRPQILLSALLQRPLLAPFLPGQDRRSPGSCGVRASHDPWRRQPGGRGVSDAKRLTELHGDRKKSWAESLRPTHSLYPSDFRWVTTALDRPPPKTRRAPCSPRPVFIDRFWHRGSPVPPVRAQCAQLRWWAFGCTTSRVTMPHTILRLPTVKARTGLSRSTIYLRVSRRHLSCPRAPRGPCRGLDRG